jgi:predicted hydrocarbon binding protein
MRKRIEDVLSEQEIHDLSIGLLREWFLTVIQAFVDTAGSQDALKFIRPHAVNAGKAAALVLQSITGITDPIEILKIGGRAGEGIWKGKYEVEVPSEGSHLIKRFRGCITGGNYPEACALVSDYCFCNLYSELVPTWRASLTKSLCKGDELCEWTILRGNDGIDIARLHDYQDYYLKQLPSPVGVEFEKVLGHEYMGEFWAIATRAFIEHSGSEYALERLGHYMRHSGMSFGIRLSERFDYHEMGAQAIGDIIAHVNDLHRRKWTMTDLQDKIEGVVEECPFAQGAMPEMCQQYCAFFNGVCEVIDPSYEFAYDRMMTKGDSTCHWVIRKRSEMKPEPSGDKLSSDVLKQLASRYVMGEISKEEYEELKEILSK